MQKVGLLGGTRFIGFHLTHALHNRGYEVTLFNRGKTVSPKALPSGIKHVTGNRACPHDLQKLFYTDYDFVIDLSGYTLAHVEPIVRGYQDKIGQYLFCSTSSVYKIPPPYLFNEDSERTFAPNTYGGDKSLVEDMLLGEYLKNKWPITIFRPQGVWGPYEAPQGQYIFPRLLNSIPILMEPNNDVRVNLLYMPDFVSAFLLAMHNPVSHGSVYGVAGDDITSKAQLIDLCGKVCSRKPELKYTVNVRSCGADAVLPWPEWDLVADNMKIKNELGLNFTRLEDALHETFQWMLHSPNLCSYRPFRGEHYLLMDRPIPWGVTAYWRLKDLAKSVGIQVRWRLKYWVKMALMSLYNIILGKKTMTGNTW